MELDVQDPDPSSTKMCQRFMKDIVVKPSVPRYTVPSVAPFAYQEEHYSAILRTYVKSRREQLDALASLQATMSSDDVSGSTPAKSSGAGDLQKAPGRGEAPQEKTDEQAEDQAQEEAAEDSCKPHDPKVQGPTKRCIINLAHGTEGKADWVYYKTMIASDCYRLYCEGKMCLPDFQKRVPHIHVLLSNQSQILHEMEMTLRAASSETITVRGAAYVTAPEGAELPGLGTQRIVVGAFYDYLQGGSIMELLRVVKLSHPGVVFDFNNNSCWFKAMMCSLVLHASVGELDAILAGVYRNQWSLDNLLLDYDENWGRVFVKVACFGRATEADCMDQPRLGPLAHVAPGPCKVPGSHCSKLLVHSPKNTSPLQRLRATLSANPRSVVTKNCAKCYEKGCMDAILNTYYTQAYAFMAAPEGQVPEPELQAVLVNAAAEVAAVVMPSGRRLQPLSMLHSLQSLRRCRSAAGASGSSSSSSSLSSSSPAVVVLPQGVTQMVASPTSPSSESGSSSIEVHAAAAFCEETNSDSDDNSDDDRIMDDEPQFNTPSSLQDGSSDHGGVPESETPGRASCSSSGSSRRVISTSCAGAISRTSDTSTIGSGSSAWLQSISCSGASSSISGSCRSHAQCVCVEHTPRTPCTVSRSYSISAPVSPAPKHPLLQAVSARISTLATAIDNVLTFQSTPSKRRFMKLRYNSLRQDSDTSSSSHTLCGAYGGAH